MSKIAVLGAGRIGRPIAEILARRPGLSVTLCDQLDAALKGLSPQITPQVLNVRDAAALDRVLSKQDVVISACQYTDNIAIAESALRTKVSYFDLTEDVRTTRAVRTLAQQASSGQVFVPQCGLAPGYVGILASHIARQFDELDTLKLRVGALPQLPNNAMLYNLTWSTEGLINEYCNPCEAIKNGQFTKVLALEGLEQFTLDGAMYEAFNTSGGLGTLCESLQGKVRDLTYKTIRYPGHRHLMDFLINGLRLGEEGERRQLLMRIIEDAVPVTDQDVVLIVVSATGYRAGKLTQYTEHHRINSGCSFDDSWSAIQITTAGSVCAVVDLFLQGRLLTSAQDRGFVSQENISFEAFMACASAEPYRTTALLWKGHQP